MDGEPKHHIWKVLSDVSFCSLSTCSDGEPHTTIVQAAVTSELDIIILTKKTMKKIDNIKKNIIENKYSWNQLLQ